MKLLQIWNARHAWTTLSALRKPPGIAYRLLKYERLIDAELTAIEKTRSDLVLKAANAGPGVTEARVEPNTPEFVEYVTSFNELLATTDAELKPFETLNMDELTAMLDTQAGNTLSEGELGLLEPFFTQEVEEPKS